MADNLNRKQKIKAWKKDQEVKFLASLPFTQQIFQELFDFLDVRLESDLCAHDFKLTTQFLKSKNIDINNHLSFFIDNGGGCDCEVLMNMEELFPDNGDEQDDDMIREKREKVNQLNLPNLVIDAIPAPWKLFRTGHDYEFQFGKNSDIKIDIVDCPDMTNWSNEDFWKASYEKMTELKLKTGCEVVHDNFDQYDLVTVKTKDWVPAFVWIRPANNTSWCLLFNTQMSRLRGDINELKILLKKIKTDHEC